ncbi:MAG: CCA tRNA nucleotidyltransferase [Terracidiphilus sp.]
MPDYIYLLENRLSADQQHALRQLREAAREAGTILFLTGDAVRDLTSGHAVRELEVAVHGNALKLKKTIEKLGGKVWGEDEASRSLYLCFPGTVRVDLVSTHRTEYPKPGKPAYHPASIQEDLRRRDFTVNAMAISLNEGSFGLLMDPLNGAADIESRTLRLVSNYGFLDEPSLMIRATRYMTRLGWEMDPKTQTRYQNARDEGVIEHLSPLARSRELEQIGHEEEGLKVLAAHEAEGWMKVLFPAWTVARADEEKLNLLHEQAVELLVQGVHADMSAAQMQLLTAKMPAKDLAALKKLMLRPGFVEEWNSLDAMAAGFAKMLLAKENQQPSICFKLFRCYDPEAVLWLGFTTKDGAVKERYQNFLKVWPEVRQRTPYALMLEMRITPELANYNEVVESVFLELIDGRLTAPEEMRAFLEPHSPPAPPPQVSVKRPRAKRGEAKVKESAFDEEEEEEVLEDDLDEIGRDDEEIDLEMELPKVDLVGLGEAEADLDGDDEEETEEPEREPAPEVKPGKRAPRPAAKAAPPEPAVVAPKEPPAKPEKAPAAVAPPVKPVKPAPETKAKAPAKAPAKVPAKPIEAAKPVAKPAVPAAKPAVKAAPPADKKPAPHKQAPKPVAKPAAKPVAKKAAKPAPKPAPAKKQSAPKPVKATKPAPKPAPKKPAGKPGKKR